MLSIGLPNFGSFAGGDWRRFVDLARVAEDSACHRVVVVDHVVMGSNTDAYRWGRFPTSPDDPWLEPLTVLAAMAAVTSELRLATGILIAPLRPPALLAKTAATLDVISEGRLELGVGMGWQREEYAALGLDWSDRGRLLDDALGACVALWGEPPTEFRGHRLQFDDVYCVPRPHRPTGIPLLIAGTLSERNIERIARWGSGWIPIMGASSDDVAAGIATAHAALRTAGRGIDDFIVPVPLPVVRDGDRPDLDATLAGAPALLELGATAVNLPLQAFCRDLDGAGDVLRRAGERFALETGQG